MKNVCLYREPKHLTLVADFSSTNQPTADLLVSINGKWSNFSANKFTETIDS